MKGSDETEREFPAAEHQSHSDVIPAVMSATFLCQASELGLDGVKSVRPHVWAEMKGLASRMKDKKKDTNTF